MLNFFLSLPKLQDYKGGLYIPGYTETLGLIDGVRVIPNKGFTEQVSSFLQRYFISLEFPYYYIPIKKGKVHYGFILKGQEKKTIKWSNYHKVFNMEAIWDDRDYIFLVEGIKDAYLLLRLNQPVISVLTSMPSRGLLEEIKETGKKVIFIPDNDKAGSNARLRFLKLCFDVGVRGEVYSISRVKDLGDFFDLSLRDLVYEEMREIKRRYIDVGGESG